MTRYYDVAIVGCGPSGNALAYRLARAGVEVLLLEKDRIPRDKACGGGLSRKTLAELPFSVDPAVEKHIDGTLLVDQNGEVVRKNIPGAGVMVSRAAFDAWMTGKAVEAGAELRDRTPFDRYDVGKDFLEVLTNRDSYRVRVLVGADGVYSRLRRQLYPGSKVRGAPAMEAVVYPRPGMLDRLGSRTLLDLRAIRGGYAWIFPKRDHFNVGLYRFVKRRDNLNLRSRLQQFLNDNPLLRDPISVHLKAFSIPYAPVAGALVKDRVLLVGDAAGWAEAFYGEGIFHAVRSGHLAADCILRYLAAEGDLEDYDRATRSLRVQSVASRWTAAIVYALPPRVGRALIRNRVVNEWFARLVTGKLSPLGCFLCAAGLLPIWLWAPWSATFPMDEALEACCDSQGPDLTTSRKARSGSPPG